MVGEMVVMMMMVMVVGVLLRIVEMKEEGELVDGSK